jgi:signal transduction histidine kinase
MTTLSGSLGQALHLSDRDELAFADSLNRRNLIALRFLILFACIGYPLFGILDYVVVPKKFLFFMSMRVLCMTIALIILFISTKPWSLPYVRHLGLIVGWTAGFLIGLMVQEYGGYKSSYYAGLNLVILPSCLLFIWSSRWNLLMGGPIYLSYLLPSLLSKEHPIDNVALFIAHNVFILVTVIFIAIIQHFNLLRQREIFFANLELSKAKNSLEDINQKLENTNQKLEDTNQELHKLDRIKNEFFANITHELRTPLTMILTPVDAIIQKDIGDFQPEQMTYFHSIRENGLRLLKLINDLLDLTRLQDSQIKLRIEQVQIMDFLNNIIEIVQGMADRKRIKLSMNCHEDSLWFDQVHLERVMLNIIANSLKFTPPGGEIQIETLHTNGDVTISVRDTGIGIPQHHIPHIFDRFFQSDSSSTRQYGGSGIGLSLVKELIELHEGQIRVESEEGQGTTVYIKLHKGHSHFRKELLDRRQKTRAEEHKRRSDDLGVSE